jgi:hypothetical protein
MASDPNPKATPGPPSPSEDELAREAETGLRIEHWRDGDQRPAAADRTRRQPPGLDADARPRRGVGGGRVGGPVADRQGH